MVVGPTPSLADDVLPFSASAPGRREIQRPRAGLNVQGGKEWLRLLFSKEGAPFFSETTSAHTVIDAAEGLDLGTAFASAQEARPPARTPSRPATRTGIRRSTRIP